MVFLRFYWFCTIHRKITWHATEVQLHSFLTVAPDGSECQLHKPAALHQVTEPQVQPGCFEAEKYL
jgi:hypothetical protein